MTRRNEANVTSGIILASVGGGILGHAMIAAVPAIGEAVGTAIRSGINAKRARDWNAAVQAKAAEAEKLLAEFDDICRELAWHPKFLAAVIRDQFELKRELENALNRATVFDVYDSLVTLTTRIRPKLARHRMIADALFNAAVNAKMRAKREREAA